MPDECAISNVGACFHNMRDWLSAKWNDIKQQWQRATLKPIFNDDCRTYEYNRKKVTVPMSSAPLNPVTDFIGVSTGGLTTSIAIPKLNLTLDAGPSIADLKITDRIFISHTDSDHFTGLDAVMCESIKREKPFEVFISENARSSVESLQKKLGRKNEGIKVHFHFVKPHEVRELDSDTRYDFFNVLHSPTSIGLGVQKREGGKWQRVLTYLGDVSLKEMFEKRLIGQIPISDTMVMEASIMAPMQALVPFMEIARARHTSISDVKRFLVYSQKKRDAASNGIKDVVLIHTLGLPPFVLPCSTIGDNIVNYFGNGEQQMSFLTTCSEMNRSTDSPKSPRVVVA